MNLSQLGLGVAAGSAIGLLAYLAKALTRSGAIAAAVVGALTFGIGGLQPAALLLIFFVSSSLLSRVGGPRKKALSGQFDKHGPRDHAQVVANGLVPTALSVAYGLTGDSGWLLAAAGALAASNADTWATELGVLSGRRPWLITTLQRVESGTSGAISIPGSIAAVAGALLVGLVATLIAPGPATLPAVLLGGVVGAFADSLLGATVQGRFHCPNCGKLTERHPRHSCGSETVLVGGWGRLKNDQVNLMASLAGAMLSTLWIVGQS